MKKNIITFLVLILGTLSAHAQHVFTIGGIETGDVLPDSSYVEIYLSDDYFHFDKDAKPIATVPVVNNSFHYDLPIDRMRSVKILFNGEEDENFSGEYFAVPDESISISDYDVTPSNGYLAKVERGVWAARNNKKNYSPHIPKIEGKKVWSNMDEYAFENIVHDVYFNDKETIVRIYPTGYIQDRISVLIKNKVEFCLKDFNTHKEHRIVRKIFGGDSIVTTEQIVYGHIVAFEPLPKDTKFFLFGILSHPHGDKDEIEYINKGFPEKLKKGKVRLNIDATESKKASGYIVKMQERQYYAPVYKADVTFDKSRKFSTDLYVTFPYDSCGTFYRDPDYVSICATYPDGSISTDEIKFVLMPGETANVKITDDGYTIGGSKKYKQWQEAADLDKKCDNKNDMTYILSEHCKEEGFIRYFMFNKVFPASEIKKSVTHGLLNDYSYGKQLESESFDEELSAKREKEEKEKEDTRIENEEKTDEGSMFVDFEVEYEGKVTHLSDYVGKGKYVLVDFWASWCGPCCAEIPFLKDVWEKYKGDNFEVVGVPSWDEPEKTLKAIKKYGIEYPQMINAQDAGTLAYGITGIPEIILFAPDGKILARGLRGFDIEKTVKEYVK